MVKKQILSKFANKTSMPLFIISFQHCAGVPSQWNKAGIRNERHIR